MDNLEFLTFRTVIEGNVRLMKKADEKGIKLDPQGDVIHANLILHRPTHDMDVVEEWEDRLKLNCVPYCLAQFEEGYLIFTKSENVA